MPDPAEARTLPPPGRGRADPPIRATLAREDHTDIRHTVPPRQSPRYRSGTCVAGRGPGEPRHPQSEGAAGARGPSLFVAGRGRSEVHVAHAAHAAHPAATGPAGRLPLLRP